jgi:N-acetylglutamate synthase-like GNAT family acetyltransferase
MPSMSTSQLQVRRATIDDLPKLVPLWREEKLDVDDLEKRFKEFQVADDSQGNFIGALGLQIAGQQGRLHSEVFARPEHADAAREKLLERVQILANNHGLVRVWTQFSTPFWHQNGFAPAPGDVLAKLPPAFSANSAPWLFLKLREEGAGAISIDKEFALFKEAERERTEAMFRQARFLKIIAYVLAGAVLILIGFLTLRFFQVRRRRMNQE